MYISSGRQLLIDENKNDLMRLPSSAKVACDVMSFFVAKTETNINEVIYKNCMRNAAYTSRSNTDY